MKVEAYAMWMLYPQEKYIELSIVDINLIRFCILKILSVKRRLIMHCKNKSA